ncbi:stigma-specific STIG1-like protein 1 [Durio zibethinus]|uniref:Stigma-specific STIG1-like protein 1 n=1 Tax=Durio zibethinus TaxID=66656 RepID=A0A6P5ZMK6_DURZI|nr:stigma-specific STIG1-like protein 1 [Durio zibethinus]
MQLTKIIVAIAITVAISITLAMKSIGVAEEKLPPITLIDSSTSFPNADQPLQIPSKRVSRFLKQEEAARNPRAAHHCNKDKEVCYVIGGHNSTCCNNKCVYLVTDNQNCGACKRKCKYTEVCCRGECVNISFDKRHCGECNHRCDSGEYCIYGMCNYT